MPPKRRRASNTVTRCPMSARKYAQVSPLGPPPMTATVRAVSTLRDGGATVSAGAWSTA